MAAKLPVLAEIGAPASSNGRAWGLRRGDLEAIRRRARRGRRAACRAGDRGGGAGGDARGGAGRGRRRGGTATALIECDVERPRIAADLGLSPTPGLHEYLRWEATPADIVQPLTLAGSASPPGVRPLACVCAGRPARDARTLLGLGSFHHMATKLRDAYELVVLLGPPLEGAGGALSSAAGEADCVLTALSSRPDRRAAKANAEALAWLGASALGAVVVSA